MYTCTHSQEEWLSTVQLEMITCEQSVFRVSLTSDFVYTIFSCQRVNKQFECVAFQVKNFQPTGQTSLCSVHWTLACDVEPFLLNSCIEISDLAFEEKRNFLVGHEHSVKYSYVSVVGFNTHRHKNTQRVLSGNITSFLEARTQQSISSNAQRIALLIESLRQQEGQIF